MLHEAVPNLRHALFLALLFVIVLLATSCADPETPQSTEPGITPTESLADMVTEAHWPEPHFSPGQHLRFERISLDEGLSQSTVFCMLQDSQGFMWFGTEDGLNRYDGYTFTVYRHDREDTSSLGSNWISAMLEDASGALWFGTIDRGLDLYDRKLDQFTHFRNDPQDPSSLSHNRVTALFQDRDGDLWIGTGGGGLDRYDREAGRFVHYQQDPGDPNSMSSNAVSAIYEDRGGALWIGTDGGGLSRLVFPGGHNNDVSQAENLGHQGERWWRYAHDPGDPQSLSHNHVTAISEDRSGALWVGTGGGGLNKLILSRGDASGFIHYRHDPADAERLSSDVVSAIYQDREGVLWIGTRDEGLNRLDPERETFAHYQNVPGDTHSLSTNLILSIFQDREGVLWFGTIGGGVNQLDVGGGRFPHFKNDPSSSDSLGDNMVRAFFQETGGPLWIGTMFGGVDRFDRETGEWRHYVHEPDDPGTLSNNWTSVIYTDGAGALWIGTARGLDRYDREEDNFTHYQPDPDAPPSSDSNDVRVLYEDQAGEFWVGTKDGLNRFDRDKEIWSHTYRHDPSDPHSLGRGWVLDIEEDRNGDIWVGTTRGGLNRFEREQEAFVRYENDPGDPSSLSGNRALALLLAREGELWVGTQGGLDRFDPVTQTFTHYREAEGLPNETVYCILEDGHGRLWLSTNRGLSRFDPGEETFSNFDVTDGLQSNEFNGSACHVSDNGEMFFGGIDGFNAFFPDQIRENPVIPPVVVTSLTQHGRQAAHGQAIDGVREMTLRWPDSAFEFEFSALSFAQPEKNQYAYYLEGFEEVWNEVGARRSGQYTNLPGGTYTLRVKGSNNDGVWNETGTAVQIAVVPPFWATWWFRGVALLVLAGVIIGGYRLRLRAVELRSRELAKLVEERTAELTTANLLLEAEIEERKRAEAALAQNAAEVAVSEERSRLARDLHDSVTQSLHSSTLMAEAGRRLAADGDLDRTRHYLGRLSEISHQALKEMRLLVYELRPLALRQVGLVGALQQRLDAVERRAGVDARLVVIEGGSGESHEIELPADVEEALYPIAQEALNNALKHAKPSSVKVALRVEGEPPACRIVLEVADDGSGFDVRTADNAGGIGLASMRERAERVGGILTIHSVLGEGTSVRVMID